MGFDKKLVLAGLAVGITAYMLYKASKKHHQSHASLSNQSSYGMANAHSNSGHGHGSSMGGVALGGAAMAAAGAAYGHHKQQVTAPAPTSTAPSGGGGAGGLTWDSLRDWKHIANLLATCVMDQYLYPFYTFADVTRIAQHIAASGALVQCADSWQLPPYLAQDLVKLALFDVMFLLDDSASMRSEGTRRRDSLAGILKRAADAAARFDPDGMEVAWMNAPVQQRIHNTQEADQLTMRCQYDGRATPMGFALESKILQPLVLQPLAQGRLAKPALILVITDGRPTGSTEKGEKIVQVLKHAKAALSSSRYGEDAVSFQIAAVGNDREAQDWLDSIDNDPSVGDLVDVCSDIAIESAQVRKSTGIELTQELYCLKLLLGGIDSSYDASDESSSSSWSRSAKRKAEKKAHDKAAKEARFGQQLYAFKRDRDAALGGATPVPSAGGALPPQQHDVSLSGYQHQPSYPPAPGGYNQAPPQQQYPQHQQYQQPSGYAPPPPQQQGYGAPGGYAQQQPYPPAQSAYGAPSPAPQGQQQGYAPSYPNYGAAPPPYPNSYPQQYNQQRSADGGQPSFPSAQGGGQAGGAAYAPGAGGFAMPNPQTNQPAYNPYPQQQQQQYGQQPPPPSPFGFPQARPGGGGGGY